MENKKTKNLFFPSAFSNKKEKSIATHALYSQPKNTIQHTQQNPHPHPNPQHSQTKWKSIYGGGVQLYKGSYVVNAKYTPLFPHILNTHIGKNSHPIKVYDRENTHKIKTKVVVFDLDETIGAFTDLYTLWNIIKQHYSIPTDVHNDPSQKITWQIKQSIFNELVDLYPEFLRTNIISILEFLTIKIKNKECSKIYIYTNNQCVFPEWITLIISYLNYCLNAETTFFEKPVCAFKIKNKIIEKMRTTQKKKYSDLITCTLIPNNAEICFVDDKEHPEMKCDKIYYIQPPPYYHPLTAQTIINRFITSSLYQTQLKKYNIANIKPILDAKQTQTVHYSQVDYFENMTDEKMEIHNIEVSRKMFYYIREFFFLSIRRPKTKKRLPHLGKYTKRVLHSLSNSSANSFTK